MTVLERIAEKDSDVSQEEEAPTIMNNRDNSINILNKDE